jgi:hypothetical protein
MQLGRRFGMVFGVQVVAMGRMRMLGGGFMVVLLVVLRRFPVVVRSLFVMFGRLFVVFGDLLSVRHSDSPECVANEPSAGRT